MSATTENDSALGADDRSAADTADATDGDVDPAGEADNETDATDQDDADAPPDEARRAVRRWIRQGRRVAPAVICVVLLMVSGYLGWQLWSHNRVQEAGEAAQRTAVAYAQVLTSIDSNNVDQNFKEVLDGATGEFKDMYTQSSVQLRQLLIDNKATAHGAVVDSAVQSQSVDKVVVLLFIDQTVTNTASPDPRIDRSRIKMTLEMVDGRWRASKVELI